MDERRRLNPQTPASHTGSDIGSGAGGGPGDESDQLRQGDIVDLTVADPRGRNQKRRPVLVVTADDEILLDSPIVGLAVTTSFPDPTPPNCHPIPWSPHGAAATGLRSRSAVVCDWFVRFQPSDIHAHRGRLPKRHLYDTLTKMQTLLDDQA